MITSPVALADIARLDDHVREYQEHGQNHGARVNGIQMWGGGKDGESWCAYALTMWLDKKFKGKAPIERTGSCDRIYELAVQNGWFVDSPHVDDIILFVHPGTTDAHHCALVTNVPAPGVVTQIAGNTSEDGKSDNGDRCAERDLTLNPEVHKIVRYPKPWA